VNGTAHECCNFLSHQGFVYGHVESIRGEKDTKIVIENLGATKKDDCVGMVDVIWTATSKDGGRRVIGWYRNATIFRNRKYFENNSGPTKQHQKDKITNYRIRAKTNDVYLIPENERNLRLGSGTGWMGEKAWWYAVVDGNKEIARFLDKVNTLIGADKINPDNEDDCDYFDDPIEPFFDLEGKRVLRKHLSRERSSKLVKRFKASLATYNCSVCDFDFGGKYGTRGEGFIEAHHQEQLSSLKKAKKISIDDLAAVCSNCHRMLHKTNPVSTIEDLKHLLLYKCICKGSTAQ
jgi:5-methylcytosine-specific restriction protein A